MPTKNTKRHFEPSQWSISLHFCLFPLFRHSLQYFSGFNWKVGLSHAFSVASPNHNLLFPHFFFSVTTSRCPSKYVSFPILFSFVPPFIRLSVPVFLHLFGCVCCLDHPIYHLFVSPISRDSISACFRLYVYPYPCSIAQKSPCLKHALFHRTFTTPIFYNYVALSSRLSFFSAFCPIFLPFIQCSDSASLDSSAALFLWASVHLLPRISIPSSFGSSSTISRRPFVHLLLPLFLLLFFCCCISPFFRPSVPSSLRLSTSPSFCLIQR